VNRFRTIAVAAIAGFVLVACGPAASGNESPGGAASQAAQSQAAQGSQGGFEPSIGEGVVSELEDLIPDKVGDLTMQKSSFRGNDYLVSPDSDPETVQFIQDVGVSPSDIAVALGSGFNADFTSGASVIIIRANGADSNKLVNAFKKNMQASTESPIEWASANVGGKGVESNGATEQATYLYVHGDTLFIVSALDDATAGEILGGLP
jgi:hypothetical protein